MREGIISMFFTLPGGMRLAFYETNAFQQILIARCFFSSFFENVICLILKSFTYILERHSLRSHRKVLVVDPEKRIMHFIFLIFVRVCVVCIHSENTACDMFLLSSKVIKPVIKSSRRFKSFSVMCVHSECQPL